MFINNFIRHKCSSSSLVTIEQEDNESLWSFITHFNREALTVDEMDDKLLLAASTIELVQIYSSISSMIKNHRPWLNLSIQPQSFMNVEDVIIAKKRKRAK